MELFSIILLAGLLCLLLRKYLLKNFEAVGRDLTQPIREFPDVIESCRPGQGTKVTLTFPSLSKH